MSKDKISDYSATANSNTDIGGINIDEGCAPSGINDAIRTLMKQLKDWQSGSQDVYIHPAGSASVPSITATGDTNTGLFFPAADTVGIATGGTERARVDSSGNLGLGVTPSAWGSGFKAIDVNTYGAVASSTSALRLFANSYNDGTNWTYKTTAAASRYELSGGAHYWYNAASGTAGNAISFTQAMALDASGNLAVGISSPTFADGKGIHLNNASGASRFHLTNNTTGTTATDGSEFTVAGSDLYIINNESATMQFWTAATERARITSSGYFKASNTGTYISSTGAYHELSSDSSSAYAVYIRSTASATGSFGISLSYPNRAPNDTGNDFITCSDSAATRFTARSNGGLANYSANNVNLSDERTKTDIQDAGSYLAKICAIPVRTFKYKDQTDDLLNLGCIAQEVETVAPELVDVSGFGETPEDGVPLKAIYQTDLQYALMKSIQELKAIVDAQAAEIAALKG